MNKNYDNDYYIPLATYEDKIYVKPLQKTADRDYILEKLIFGEEPLFFENSNKEAGIRHIVPDILFDGANMIVKGHIRDFLKEFETPGMQLYPAIYIDDNENWHDDYWLLNFYDSLDCWDRNNSIYEPEPPDSPIDPDIRKFSLDNQVLDKIPKEQRLVFRMGGSSEAFIFMHQDIVDFLRKINSSGVRFFRISEFECSFEFKPGSSFSD